MKSKILQILSLILCILSLSVLLGACTSIDHTALTAFPSLTVDKDGTVTATVTLNGSEVESRRGEKAYLYELLPGEAAPKKNAKPLAEVGLSSEMRLTFPLHDGEHTRLYSSFSLCYQDGKPILPPRVIDNPEVLAKEQHPFLWDLSPKGLVISDGDRAASLGTSHAMVEIDLARLTQGTDRTFSVSKTAYRYSASVLAETDRGVLEAYRGGMQVSLRIRADRNTLSAMSRAAYLDFLASRYSSKEHGIVTSHYLDASALSLSSLASMTAVSRLALLSHVGCGEVFVLSPFSTSLASRTYFAELGASLEDAGMTEWGAAITLTAYNGELWDCNDPDALTPETLGTWSRAIREQQGAPSYLALCDIAFPDADENVQAVSFAYAYAAAASCGFSRIYYGAEQDDRVGLYTTGGKETSALSFYRDIDVGLPADARHLTRSYSEKVYQALDGMPPSRRLLYGTGNPGAGSGHASPFFDFTDGTIHGFSAVGAANAGSDPTCKLSASYQKNVLYVSLDSRNPETGVRKLLSNGEALRDATSISIHALSQYKDRANTSYTVTLRLSGVDSSGDPVTLEATSPMTAHTWQTVNFNIAAFVSIADLSKPVVLTLLSNDHTASPDAATEPFGFWIYSINVYSPQGNYGWIPILILVLPGVLIGFGLILWLYRRAANKPAHIRRPRRIPYKGADR